MVRRINLVPRTDRPRTTTDVGVLLLVAVVVLAIFGLGFGYYTLNNNLSDREQALTDLQQQTAAQEGQLLALRQYELLQAERANTEATVQTIYAGRTIVSEVLDAISLVIPNTVWFQSLSLTTTDPTPATGTGAATPGSAPSDNKLALEGDTYSFEEVAQFLVRLQLVPSLVGVELGSAGPPKGATDPAKDVKGFSISADVVNNQPEDTPLPISQVEVETP